MAEILVIAVASAVTSGISISASFVMVGTWLGVEILQRRTKIMEPRSRFRNQSWKPRLIGTIVVAVSNSSTASVVSLDDSEDSFEDETDK